MCSLTIECVLLLAGSHVSLQEGQRVSFVLKSEDEGRCVCVWRGGRGRSAGDEACFGRGLGGLTVLGLGLVYRVAGVSRV